MVRKILTSGWANGNSFALFSNLWEPPCAVNQIKSLLYHFQAEFILALLIWVEFQEHAPLWLPNPVAGGFLLTETHQWGLAFKQSQFVKCIIYCTNKYRRQEQPMALWELCAQEFPPQTFFPARMEWKETWEHPPGPLHCSKVQWDYTGMGYNSARAAGKSWVEAACFK